MFTGDAPDPAQPYWNMDMEPLLGGEEMRRLQLARLRDNLERVHENAPFWRRRLDRYGITPAGIGSLRDFAVALPPFRKQDYREFAESRNADTERVLAEMMPAPLSDVRLMAATSGTTGEPTPYPFTAADLRLACESWARMWWRAGVRPGDRVLQAFALGMFVAGVPIALANLVLGACVIPVGAEAGAERILRTSRSFRGTVLNCTPSLAEHLIERAPEAIGAPVSSLGITTIMSGGEPGAGLPEVRRKLESAYGARLYDFGAGAGVSCDHPTYQGMHWVADDLMLYELVDPDTDEPVPLEDGAEGEACFTSLAGFDGMLWLRQSMGDIHRVETSPCPCGRTGLRYRVVGRTDDMLKVKGVMLYPSHIDDLVASFAPRLTGEFRIVLDEPPPRVVPPLRLRIEYGTGVREEDLPALEADVVAAMHGRLRVRPAISWLPPGSLPRSAHKSTLIEHRYRDAHT